MADLIDRQAAIDFIAAGLIGNPKEPRWSDLEVVNFLKSRPSAQPEYRMDEWCTDCKEYDQEKHCCPRFNHVIRTTLQEVQAEQPEIVRCKDCKHHEDEEPGMVYCPYFVGGWVSNDFFCGNGARCDMRGKEESDGRFN